MALDFNTEPYFDDYKAEKDFYRILFRPSYAVQARELTQIQTILQNQISRFGDHAFKNGSQVIPGSVNVDNKVHFVKLQQLNGTVDVTTYLSDFKDKIVTGETSGVKMRVVDTSNDGVISDNLDVPTLYCKIEGTAADNVTNRLVPGENLIAYVEDNRIATNFRLKEDQLNDIQVVIRDTGDSGETATVYTDNISSDVIGYSYSVEVMDGIYYVDGIFVRNPKLKIYAGRFTNTPSCRVGFKVDEQTITPEDDTSILDNATGSYNFAAPGAHRYKISLSLVKLDLVATDSIKFVELVRIVDGRLQYKVETSSYAELEKTFARRTFDESGNYEVNKFKLSVREHLNDGSNLGVFPPVEIPLQAGKIYGNKDKFVAVVDPGKAYIQGYEVESTASQFIEFNKAREINGDEGNHIERIGVRTIGINNGNYANVVNLYKYPNISTYEEVYLVNTLQNRPAQLKANVNTSTGAISSVDVIDGGEGYTAAPTVSFLRTGSGTGTDATATAVISGSLAKITITNGGSGYTSAPTVAFSGGGGSGAAGTAVISGGVITSVLITNSGSGYTSNPTITFSNGGGSGAAAGATISAKITSVTVNTGGTGYAPQSIAQTPEVRAYNNISLGAAPLTSNIVGTARIKALQLQSGDYSAGQSTQYKLGFININMFSGYSFERDVKSVVGKLASGNFSANINPSQLLVNGNASSTANSNIVTGNGTLFNEVLKAGDIVYLNDIKIGTVLSFSNTSITLTSGALATVTNGRIGIFSSTLYEPSFETLVFPVGQSVVKTLRGVDVDGDDTKKETTIIVRRLFNSPNKPVNNAVTFEEPMSTDETFLDSSDLDHFTVFNSVTNLPVNITASQISFDNNTTRTKVTISGLPSDEDYYMIASVVQTKVPALERTKLVQRNFIQTITGKKLVSAPIVELNNCDILKLIKVEMTPGNYDAFDSGSSIDITERYTLDNGQRPTHYATGKLQLKPGYQTPSGALRVTYDYFKASTTGNYFSVDSYTTASGVSYEEIPSYFVVDNGSGKKVEISLTDVVDFRPYIGGANAFNPELPMIGADMSAPTAFYLGRIDKVVLDSVGRFSTITGVPSTSPKEPEDPKEGLILATVAIPPYTKNIADIIIQQRDNRRYTMRDIGKLERRISNLEYYVTLSLLEKDTATMQIKDETTGLDRFKNGFIVDQFTGHNVGDVKNDDYRVSVDSQNRILRPMAQESALELVENITSGTARQSRDYKKTGDLITLPYTENAYIFNNNATRAMDIHAISMGAFKGQIDLIPEGDTWKSTERRPDLVAVDNNNYDAIKFMADQLGVTGTKWNEWQTNWTSVSSRTVRSETRVFDQHDNTWGDWLKVTGYETTYTDQSGYNWRDGIRTDLTSSVNAQDYGDRIVDMSYIPFMRARPITIIAKNLKNTTRFWSFFDNVAVDSYVQPADRFVVTRVSNSLMSFDQEKLNNNVIADIPARAYNGKIEQAFSIGDVLVNTVHTPTNIYAIAAGSTSSTLSVTVADDNSIAVGHHVQLYNLDYHNAYNQKNLNDLHDNQIIPASDGINSNVSTAKELNLRKFKVIAISNAGSNPVLTLQTLDGSAVGSFSTYTPSTTNTTYYASGKFGKLYRLRASCVVAYGGIVSETEVSTGNPITQEIYVVNVKNGFAPGETLTGSVLIGNTSSYNGVTLTSVNGAIVDNVPTMMTKDSSLITDKNGTIVATFYLPETDELSFRTGERTFKLTDNQSNSNASFDSIGSAVYYAQGISLSKERTIVSTRTAQFVQAATYEDTQSLPPVRRTTTSTRQLYQYAYDPLAQTFTVNSEGGAFITGIDLYFAVKGNRPVSIELRNTDNGVPSSKVIPFSQVTKTPSELNVSDDSSVATTFKFKSPVYLQDTETYAFVVMTDEPGTQVYVSEMGGTDILTKNTIAGQPLTGSLYASQNAKEWEIHTLLDMKFVMKRAKFDTSTSAEVLFRTNPPEPFKLASNPFQIVPNSTKIRVFAKDHGLLEGDKVVISGVEPGFYGANSSTIGIPHTLLNSTHTVFEGDVNNGSGLDKDSFIIDLQVVDSQSNSLLSGTSANFIRGEYGGNGVTCTKGVNVDTLFLKSSDLNFQDTKINYFVSAQQVDGTFTDYLPFIPNSNYSFPTRMNLRSYENQDVDNVIGQKSSLTVKAVMTSTNENVSPAIDIQQLSAYAINNMINDKSAKDINIIELDERVVLQHGDIQDADLVNMTPSGTITVAQSAGSVTVTGSTGTNPTNFTAEIAVGNVLQTNTGVILGTVTAIASNSSLTLASSSTALSNATFRVYSTPSIVFENVNGVGVIRTNIDTADNLLATIGIGKDIKIYGVHASVDNVAGSLSDVYTVTNVIVTEDKATYAGNTELDLVKVVLNRKFGSTDNVTVATINPRTDSDYSITVLDNYVSDIAPYGCHNASNYITRTLSLTEAASSLKIMFDANIVNKSQIKVYYRAWSGNVDLKKLPYKDTGWISTNVDPEGQFVERTIDIDNISPFNNVSIKIVLKSTDPVNVPKVKNLRVLALS